MSVVAMDFQMRCRKRINARRPSVECQEIGACIVNFLVNFNFLRPMK